MDGCLPQPCTSTQVDSPPYSVRIALTEQTTDGHMSACRAKLPIDKAGKVRTEQIWLVETKLR